MLHEILWQQNTHLAEACLHHPFVRGLAAAYHVLARLWPSMFAYQYILEARISTLDEESTADLS